MNPRTDANVRLERPWIIYAFALGFILLPMGNLARTIVEVGSQQVSRIDWIWNALVILSGVLMLRQRKGTWLLALAVLFAALGFGVTNAFNLIQQGYSPWTLLAACGGMSLGALAGLYYFRFPYLDRRDGWWGFHRRYSTDFPVFLPRYTDQKARITDLSSSGVFIRWDNGQVPPSLHPGDSVSFGFEGLQVMGTVERITSHGLGVSFGALEKDQERRVRELIARSSGIKAP